jgi:hypothetical protein
LLKKLAVIFIVAILLVKAGGYQLLVQHWQQQAYRQMVTRIDRAEYDEKDLIEISAPLELPYYTDWQDFERCDGQVQLNGVSYNYVARKYASNVMIYKCIPNHQQQAVKEGKKNADQIAFADASGKQQKKPARIAYTGLGEYDHVFMNYQNGLPPQNEATVYPTLTVSLICRHLEQLTPPPDKTA